MARHYRTTLVPARAGKPKDKAADENMVGNVFPQNPCSPAKSPILQFGWKSAGDCRRSGKKFIRNVVSKTEGNQKNGDTVNRMKADYFLCLGRLQIQRTGEAKWGSVTCRILRLFLQHALFIRTALLIKIWASPHRGIWKFDESRCGSGK